MASESVNRAGRALGAVESDRSSHFLVIGEVLRPQGVKGDIRVRVLTDFLERFSLLERVYLGEGQRLEVVERARLHSGCVLIKLAGYDSRAAVEPLRGVLVQVPVDEAMPLDEGEYYVHQIVGLEVWTAQSEYLGHVREVLTTGANDVYIIRGPRGEALLPAIDEVIREVDLEAGRLTVNLIEGLM